ncbi:hypothetical protein ROHU_008592 [Labeo rohita]|uniref:Uncharacterized protein n=1 Tax=Labeo rohita TaxID=84645 RepID=A0A498M5N7_LABRO|nr:hypothetical protein ROHU_008592 [Labeo rohita]
MSCDATGDSGSEESIAFMNERSLLESDPYRQSRPTEEHRYHAGVALSVLSELNDSLSTVFTADKCCFDIHTHAGIELPIGALAPLVFKK